MISTFSKSVYFTECERLRSIGLVAVAFAAVCLGAVTARTAETNVPPLAPEVRFGCLTNRTDPLKPNPAQFRNNYEPDDKYRLHIGDKISFQVLEDRDAPRILTVADSGELDVPYIGRTAAVDKTCRQLARQVKDELEKEFYYRASVVLALDTANRVLGRVYVWGQVHTQGPIELTLDENLTAAKALLRAGGFGDFANRKRIKVIRPATGDRSRQVFELNMIEILEEGKTDKDIPLESNDSIIVSSRFINF
jgi:protein involved in polysaccharide export with SLBB domain